MKPDQMIVKAEEKATAAAPVTADLKSFAAPDLFEALGAQVSGAVDGSSDIARFDVTIDLDNLHRGVFADLGRRVFARWNHTLHDFLCKPTSGDDDLRARVLTALTGKDVSASALIVSVLVASFGVAPGIATLVAALIVKLVVEPAAGEICKYWEEQIGPA